MKKVEKRYIYWDLDGTIWQHKQHEVELIAQHLQIPYSIKLEEEFFYMIGEFNRCFATQKVAQEGICAIIERTMLELLSAGITGREFLDGWCNTDCNTINENAEYVLRTLKDAGKQNNALTDWLFERQITQLKDFGIFDYMEKIYSCEGHYLKKNPLSIARVIKPKNREDSILIGDSLSSDIAFANNAGIDSIWFNPSRTKNLTSLKPTFEITSLLEVLDIIQ